MRSHLTKKLHVAKHMMSYTFVINVPDDGSDEPKYVAPCRTALKYCVWRDPTFVSSNE